MKKRVVVGLSMVVLLICSAAAHAAVYDAVNDFGCTNGIWEYAGYRHADGAYLHMLYGHPMISELSKYGADAYYLPDSGQPNYPFITKLGPVIYASPVTQGEKFDAVLSWTSSSAEEVEATGFVRLMGNLKGSETRGKKLKAKVVLNGKSLWSDSVTGDAPGEFKIRVQVEKGDKIRLHIENDGDRSGDMASVNMHVEPLPK